MSPDTTMNDLSPEETTAPAAPGIPHSREAEEAVVGAVLINPEVYYDVAQFLQADDFYIHRLRWIWEAFTSLHETRTPIDLLTVSEALTSKDHLNEIGGPAFLTSLVNQVPTSLHAEAYGRVVESHSIRRKLLTAANSVATMAYDEETGIDDVMDNAEKEIFSVSERRMTHDVEPIKKVMSAVYDNIDELSKRSDDIFGVPTGFTDLDRLLTGLNASDLLIVAGRPGQGKSGFLMSVARNAAVMHKKHVAVFSLEMSNEQVAQRMISQETGIDAQRLRTGKLNDDEWPKFTHAIEMFSDTKLFLDDTPAVTPLQLRTKCRRIHMEYGLDLVVIDYLQLMGGESRNDNRVQEVSYISRSLKILARELDVPVLTAAQLSRAVEQRSDKRPVLSDLRESGCLAGDTLITLAENGKQVPIQELAGKENFDIWALNPKSLKMEKMPVSRAFSTGTKSTFSLKTRLGNEIHATANHRFLTINGWKRLDELTEKDFIATPRKIRQHNQKANIPDAKIALLAHLIGDGCTLPRHAIQYTTRELDLAEIVAKLANEAFGDEIEPRIKKERTWYQVYLSSTKHHTHGVRNAIAEWMDEFDAFGLRSHEKHIPDFIFELPEAQIALFLRHLWATDGSIQLVKGKKVRPIAYYASSSHQLAKGVQTLLLRFGINARLKAVSQKEKGRDQFNVIVTGKPNLLHFGEKIGAVGAYKTARLQEIADFLTEHDSNPNLDVIPKAVWRNHVVPAMQNIRMTTRQMQAEMGGSYSGTGLYKANLSRERSQKVAEIVQSKELAALAQSDIFWDKITSIEAQGQTEVYDLTVPEHHNFVANDVIVHNSLEQDADIVMFIYRPDQYEKETQKQNVAEIIVAKHRNGPVGSVELIFQPHLAKFVDAAKQHVSFNEPPPPPPPPNE